jgi:hypothetical protein
MAEKTARIKPKRLSKSERTHRRRLKQAAGKPGAAGSQPNRAAQSAKVPKKEKDASPVLLPAAPVSDLEE